MSEAPKRRSFQFTTRGILVATFWVAVFCLSLMLFRRLLQHELAAIESVVLANLAVGCLLFVSIPAAIGGLFGRALWGAAVGIVLYGMCIELMLFVLYNWGGT